MIFSYAQARPLQETRQWPPGSIRNVRHQPVPRLLLLRRPIPCLPIRRSSSTGLALFVFRRFGLFAILHESVPHQLHPRTKALKGYIFWMNIAAAFSENSASRLPHRHSTIEPSPVPLGMGDLIYASSIGCDLPAGSIDCRQHASRAHLLEVVLSVEELEVFVQSHRRLFAV